MKFKLLFILVFICLQTVAQEKRSYIIYDSRGGVVSYGKMLHLVKNKEVILFGELHNNAIAHWLQLELCKDLSNERWLTLGAEMLERDNQHELNKYLKGEINAKELDSLARLWPNHKTDYAPLVNFARDHHLQFVATNIPRRFARQVHYNGFGVLNELSPEEKSWIAPLPIPFDIELPTYQNILKMMGDHGSENLVKAQAIKDATMAHSILSNLKPDYLFVHFNGAFHSDYYEGIVWYLLQNKKDLNFATISTVSQEDIYNLEPENMGKADFIICVDADMTPTY